jgi:hypothetical protein
MNTKHNPRLVGLMLIGLTSVVMGDTLVVTNTNDTGIGSLREAMSNADNQVGPDTIAFNIPTSDPNYNSTAGVWSIQPSSALPVLYYDSTTIDGTTQSVNQGDLNPNGPEIELDGTVVHAACFFVEGSANEIKGLILNRFSSAGVVISGDGNRVSGNYIGTDAAGTAALPNENGIMICLGGRFNVVGGGTPEERNVISGNAEMGVVILDTGTDSNEVKGNYIGTDASGEAPLGNAIAGVFVAFGPTGNTIGGSVSGERNIISGSSHQGNIHQGNGITLREAAGNIIVGNYIGTNKDGTVAVPNVSYGVAINGSPSNVIGGTAPGEGNVISGNANSGVFVRFSTSCGNTILGNYIGTDAAGLADLRNSAWGVRLDYGARENVIGPGNVIANNGANGVLCRHDSTFSNTITQNSITNHDGAGILNEEGANGALAPPVITGVAPTDVSGTACPGCVVEIFSDPSDEGAVYEGTTVADGSGYFVWSGTAAGPVVTATATDADGNTSEFSEPFLPADEDSREAHIPDRPVLEPGFPNPIGSSTEIRYGLPRAGVVSVTIVDFLGREIITLVHQDQGSGYHSVAWNGEDSAGKRASSGIYCCRVEVGDRAATRRLVLAE